MEEEKKKMSMKERWMEQLPVIAALCFSAHEEPDAEQAVEEALDILDACEELTNVTKDRSKRRERA